ncbi:hypothetical protein [Paracoccus salsus]|uniref:hypothetical protein n=1 Tax=Paracoccus salsus TaxID=2911061 RepID=UPI001F3CDF82|nr:hypothetical protein [Paracoccus salsus]MCF3973523.1 hypothetical protein [Paracoccus salsus]
MRGWLLISMLALAGCGEHQGLNPNYQFGGTRYGEYLVAREAALTTGGATSQIIPIVLPAQAPTPEQIAGASPVPVPATMGVRRVRTTRTPTTTSPSSGSSVADDTLPRAGVGPYPGSTPVLVRYAFTVEHAPGTAVYSRARVPAGQVSRICAGYASADAAQTAFLAAGGPRRDPRGMDPDGDGFVCGWDPAPFRQSLP